MPPYRSSHSSHSRSRSPSHSSHSSHSSHPSHPSHSSHPRSRSPRYAKPYDLSVPLLPLLPTPKRILVRGPHSECPDLYHIDEYATLMTCGLDSRLCTINNQDLFNKSSLGELENVLRKRMSSFQSNQDRTTLPKAAGHMYRIRSLYMTMMKHPDWKMIAERMYILATNCHHIAMTLGCKALICPPRIYYPPRWPMKNGIPLSLEKPVFITRPGMDPELLAPDSRNLWPHVNNVPIMPMCAADLKIKDGYILPEITFEFS